MYKLQKETRAGYMYISDRKKLEQDRYTVSDRNRRRKDISNRKKQEQDRYKQQEETGTG